MQIVINIPDKQYNDIIEYYNSFPAEWKKWGLQVIKNGTPLPKGHGRIGDLDKLIRNMKERNDDNGGEPLNAVDRGYDLAYQHMVKEAKECVFIEADRSEEE